MRSGLTPLFAWGPLLAWLGCAPASKKPFPDGFLFGTAIAGFQVEAGCPTLSPEQCEDRRSDWYQFVTAQLPDTKSYLTEDPVSSMAGHWELFAQDYDRARSELHNNALRLSIEWSRLFPQRTDGIEGHEALKAIADGKAIERYHAMFAALRQRGLEPMVTLNHYTLPVWIHDGVACHQDLAGCTNRGWLDQTRLVREIAKYAGFAAREFGAEVDLWATQNEPFAVVLPGYLFPSVERANPPAVTLQFDAAKKVMLAMIEAHARMYDAIHQNDAADADGDGKAAEVGLVYNMAPARPKNPDSRLDVRAAQNLFYLYNTAFLDGVIKGEIDPALDRKKQRRDDLAGRMDWLGINYYTRVTVSGTEQASLPALSLLTTFNPWDLQLWEDYPRGIYEMAMVAKEYGLPCYITENGTVDGNDDGTAPSYLVRHLGWVERAIRDGADVRGYFYWSLLDTYEWNRGMDVRMGLYAVSKDDAQKRRVARQGAAVYGRIAQAAAIPEDLAASYPLE